MLIFDISYALYTTDAQLDQKILHGLQSQPCCKALYDFEAKWDNELSFKKGDLIMLKSKVDEAGLDEEWYEGYIPSKSVFRRSKSGRFPIGAVIIVTPLPK